MTFQSSQVVTPLRTNDELTLLPEQGEQTYWFHYQCLLLKWNIHCQIDHENNGISFSHHKCPFR